MKSVKIKTESPSTRCEICHQADWYDAQTNHCIRCSGSEIVQQAKDSLTTNRTTPMVKAFSDFIKPIFIKWEKLRLLYNLFLFVTLFSIRFPIMGKNFFAPKQLLVWLIGAVFANMCFLAGPIVDAYAAWLGLRSNIVTAILFISGTILSIFLLLVLFG